MALVGRHSTDLVESHLRSLAVGSGVSDDHVSGAALRDR